MSAGRYVATLLTVFSVLCGCQLAPVNAKDAGQGAECRSFPDPLPVQIPMRDGKPLAADVYLPSKAGRFPTILIFTPYNKKILGSALPGAAKGSDLFAYKHFYPGAQEESGGKGECKGGNPARNLGQAANCRAGERFPGAGAPGNWLRAPSCALAACDFAHKWAELDPTGAWPASGWCMQID